MRFADVQGITNSREMSYRSATMRISCRNTKMYLMTVRTHYKAVSTRTKLKGIKRFLKIVRFSPLRDLNNVNLLRKWMWLTDVNSTAGSIGT